MTAQSSPQSGLGAIQGEESCDVVIIGSGIGGLCCAALCAMYGMDVIGEDRHHYHYRYAEITESLHMCNKHCADDVFMEGKKNI